MPLLFVLSSRSVANDNLNPPLASQDEHLKQIVATLYPVNTRDETNTAFNWYSIAYQKSVTQLPGKRPRTDMECEQRYKRLMFDAKRLDKMKTNAAEKKAKAIERMKEKETKSPWSKDEDRAIILAQLKPSSSMWSDLSKQCNGKTEAAIGRRWTQVLKPKVEKYLFGKNLGGNHRLYDEAGKYMINAEDVDELLGVRAGILNKQVTTDVEEIDDASDSDASPSKSLNNIPPRSAAAKQAVRKGTSPNSKKRHAATCHTHLLPHTFAAAAPHHQNKRPRTSPPPNTPDLTTVLNEIKILQRSVMAMRSMTSELLASQTELRHEVEMLRRSGIRTNDRSVGPRELEMRRRYGKANDSSREESDAGKDNASPTAAADDDPEDQQQETLDNGDEQSTSSNAVEPTTDEDMHEYIVSLKLANKWPIINNPVKAFTHDPSLIKLRFHNSAQHRHIPIKINFGTGRSHCRLCSVKGQKNSKRKTIYMCKTCCVPLCVKPLASDIELGAETHFTKWHNVVDLEAERTRCSADLLLTIDTNKKKRTEREAEADASEYFEEEEDDVYGTIEG